MRSKRTVRTERLLNGARTVLLLLSLMAGGTAAVWAFAPEWLESYEAWRIDRATDAAQRRLVAIERGEAGARGTDERRAALETLADELTGVRRGDQLANTRRRTLRSLIATLGGGGHGEARLAHMRELHGEARLARMRELVEFDPRYVEAWLDLARELAQRTDGRAEAEEILERFRALLPDDPRPAEALVEHLIASGRPERAAEVALAQDGASRSSLWRVYWRKNPKGPELKAIASPLRDPTGRLRLGVHFESPVRSLRLALPERVALRLVEPVVTLERGDQVRRIDVVDEARLVGAFLDGRTLVTSGKTRPEIELDVDTGPSMGWTLEFSSGYEPGVSPVLATAFSRPELAAALADQLPPELARQVNEQAVARALAAPFLVFWRRGEATFTGQRRAQATARFEDPDGTGARRFSVRLPVGKRAEELRVDPPGVEGTAYALESLELVSADGARSLDPAALPWTRSQSLEREGGRFTITGSDPWFCFAVAGEPDGDGEARVAEVLLEGTVR